MEVAAGIPHPLFLITTLKENGKTNACFHAWSSFSSDMGNFYAVISALKRLGHTYQNVLRTGEFCINFLSRKWERQCFQTIKCNGEDNDELTDAGLTPEPGVEIAVPRIAESFLSLECRYVKEMDLSGSGVYAVVAGQVVHIAADGEYACGLDKKYGPEGYMLNISGAYDWTGGKPAGGAVLSVRIENP